MPWTRVASGGIGRSGCTRRQRRSRPPSGSSLSAAISTMRSVLGEVPVVSRSRKTSGRRSRTSSMAAGLHLGEDLRLERLVLGFGDQPLVEHRLGFGQPRHGVLLRRLCLALGHGELHPAGPRALLLHLADAALLAPLQLLLLGDAVQPSRLLLVQL